MLGHSRSVIVVTSRLGVHVNLNGAGIEVTVASAWITPDEGRLLRSSGRVLQGPVRNGDPEQRRCDSGSLHLRRGGIGLILHPFFSVMVSVFVFERPSLAVASGPPPDISADPSCRGARSHGT